VTRAHSAANPCSTNFSHCDGLVPDPLRNATYTTPQFSCTAIPCLVCVRPAPLTTCIAVRLLALAIETASTLLHSVCHGANGLRGTWSTYNRRYVCTVQLFLVHTHTYTECISQAAATKYENNGADMPCMLDAQPCVWAPPTIQIPMHDIHLPHKKMSKGYVSVRHTTKRGM
jgi:hypothetical protein